MDPLIWQQRLTHVDACNFYGKLGVYVDHGGIALAQEEGQQIAKALGEDKIACILQNHGYPLLLFPVLLYTPADDVRSLLTVGRTVDEAAFLLSSLDHACHSQLMAEAAAANGVPKKIINDEVAQYTANAVQTPVWLSCCDNLERACTDHDSTISIPNSNLSSTSSWRRPTGRCFCDGRGNDIAMSNILQDSYLRLRTCS